MNARYGQVNQTQYREALENKRYLPFNINKFTKTIRYTFNLTPALNEALTHAKSLYASISAVTKFTPNEQDNFRSAMQAWEHVANVKFQEAEADDFDLIVAHGIDDSILSSIVTEVGIFTYHSPNGSEPASNKSVILHTQNYHSNFFPNVNLHVINVHEIGHLLGLAHPFANRNIRYNNPTLSTVSVMNYDFSEKIIVKTNFGERTISKSYYHITPSLLDIEVIQGYRGAPNTQPNCMIDAASLVNHATELNQNSIFIKLQLSCNFFLKFKTN